MTMTPLLPETLDSQARVGVRVSGSRAGVRRWLNLLPASAMATVTAVDDVANEEVEVTIGVAPTVNTLVDAKGDLIVGTADDTVARKAAGTDGAILMADSSTSDGLRWNEAAPVDFSPDADVVIPASNSAAMFSERYVIASGNVVDLKN